MFEESYGGGIDVKYWIKFIFCFILCVIFPVWIFNLTGSLSFLWKLGFTVAGAGGVILALSGKSMRLHK